MTEKRINPIYELTQLLRQGEQLPTVMCRIRKDALADIIDQMLNDDIRDAVRDDMLEDLCKVVTTAADEYQTFLGDNTGIESLIAWRLKWSTLSLTTLVNNARAFLNKREVS